MSRDSEFRLYTFISNLLKEIGWNTQSPNRGGNLYTQHEIQSNHQLKEALKYKVPDFTLKVDDTEYWIIEAKRDETKKERALKEAIEYAELINESTDISCKIITGIAGSIDGAYYVETKCFFNNTWESLQINNRVATGLLSPTTIARILEDESENLQSYEMDDTFFKDKMSQINKIMHNGGINKRNRAGVLACLLLAIANDTLFSVSETPAILIKDINSRAEQELKKYKKDNFYQEIEIHRPSSEDNHIKYKNALTQCLMILRNLNIASTIGGGGAILSVNVMSYS